LTDLAWGNWYNVTMTFTAVDGPNNDVVRYVITDLATNTQIANYTSGSWEEFYRQGVFGDPAGTIPGVDHVGFRTDFNADTDTGNGTDLFTLDPNDPNYGNPQTPFDQYSTFATPSGFYIDNFSITVTPTPGAAVVAGLGGLTMLRRRRR
ncbi:MAG: VPLPA-CTERM sorting domain-containing protein, partial [Phycisphaerales bacterium]|nr:VPLPA-CTERM sorting domain-containing protein [Phycisphaerales bacterium]